MVAFQAFAPGARTRYHERMNTQQRNVLIRNVVGGVGLVIVALFVLAFFGAFEGDQSNEAQIRKLIEGVKEEINDHDWDALLALTDSTPEEADIWKRSMPREASYVVLDTLTPRNFLTVPDNATEFMVEVTVIARYEAPGGIVSSRPASVDGKLYFVKVKISDRTAWRLDLRRSAKTFPYVPNPKLPPRAGDNSSG